MMLLYLQRHDNNLPKDVVDILSFLMPGTSVIENNHVVNKDLLTLRKSPSIMYGNFTRYEVANSTVFAYVR